MVFSYFERVKKCIDAKIIENRITACQCVISQVNLPGQSILAQWIDYGEEPKILRLFRYIPHYARQTGDCAGANMLGEFA